MESSDDEILSNKYKNYNAPINQPELFGIPKDLPRMNSEQAPEREKPEHDYNKEEPQVVLSPGSRKESYAASSEAQN